MASKIKIHSLLLVCVTTLLFLTIVIVKELDLFGIPLLFAFAILFEILLLILFLYELIIVFKHPFKILGSIILSGFKGMLQDPYIIGLQEKYPHFISGTKKFFSTEKPAALTLTFGLIISFVFFFFFLDIANLVFSPSISRIVDERILHLIPDIRTPLQTAFFSVVTFMMNWQSVLWIIFVISVFLLYKKQRFTTFLFVTITASAWLLDSIFKHFFGRLRPEKSLTLITENTNSFPSGHALFATLIFGILTYFSTRSSRHPLLKFFIFLFSIFAITLVCLSRIYMGVHYPTDLLAGIMLGFSLLAIFITFAEVNRKYAFFEAFSSKFFQIFKDSPHHNLKELIWAPILLVLFSLSFSSSFIHIRQMKAQDQTEIVQTVDSDFLSQFPRYTESITGHQIEPISFIFVGNQKQVEASFQQKKWFKADEATVKNALRALSAAFKNESYNTGTVTPAYFDAKPQTFAFQRSDKLGTFRERHHIRLWKTEYVLADGRSVWVGTASFDTGMKFSKSLILTHKIDDDIDAEREYILKSLAVKDYKYVQWVKPQIGKNAFGDQFFTDGKAILINL